MVLVVYEARTDLLVHGELPAFPKNTVPQKPTGKRELQMAVHVVLEKDLKAGIHTKVYCFLLNCLLFPGGVVIPRVLTRGDPP